MGAARDLRIEVRIKNRVLYEAVMAAAPTGARARPSIIAFCEHYGISYRSVNNLIAMLSSPKRIVRADSSGPALVTWRASALRLAKILGTVPEEVFPERLYPRIGEMRAAGPMVFTIDSTNILPLSTARQLLVEHSQERALIVDDMKAEIRAALRMLSRREEKVLCMRFGLDGEDEQMIHEIAKSLGVSSPRIRQIQDKALRKLRHPRFSPKLKDLLA